MYYVVIMNNDSFCIIKVFSSVVLDILKDSPASIKDMIDMTTEIE